MTIIDQLDQTVTTAILGDDNSVAHSSLLEQFYAILITRLAQPAVYLQLLRVDQEVLIQARSNATLFEQLWEKGALYQLLIDELTMTHHVDKESTEKLLINATPLAYQELKILANGQFLPAFLQAQQLSVRPYLPVWAKEVTLPVAVVNENVNLEKITPIDKGTMTDNSAAFGSYDSHDTNKAQMVKQTSIVDSLFVDAIENTEGIRDSGEVINEKSLSDERPFLTSTNDAIHANPSDHYDAGISNSRLKVRAHNRKNDLIVRSLIFIGALAAIGLLWALVIKPNYMTHEKPMVSTPVVTAPLSEPVAKVVIPAELTVGVDDSGQLYTCTATVGDVALQSVLEQALKVSFGDQVSTCELILRQGVANNLSGINVETLPNVFTLLRSVPFARLQLQNDTLQLEAPDETLLQRLLTDMQMLVPAISVTSAAPLPLANGNGATDDTDNNMSMMDGRNNEFINENMPLNNTYDSTYPNNNNLTGTQNYQEPDDNTNDIVEAAPLRDNDANTSNNAPAASVGSISVTEVENLANNTIIAERLRNERPVDKNLTRDK